LIRDTVALRENRSRIGFFFEIGWSVIVRSGLFGKLTEQTELSRAEAQGFLQ